MCDSWGAVRKWWISLQPHLNFWATLSFHSADAALRGAEIETLAQSHIVKKWFGQGCNQSNLLRDFPDGPVMNNLPSKAGDAGSIPGQGTKIPPAVGHLSPQTPTTKPTHPYYWAHMLCSPSISTREAQALQGRPGASKKSNLSHPLPLSHTLTNAHKS